MDDEGAILLIADDRALRDAATDFLESEAIRVVAAVSGHEAMAIVQAEERPFRAILVALDLADVNGLELYAWLRLHAVAPVAFVSADSSPGGPGFALTPPSPLLRAGPPGEFLERVG